MDTNMKESQFLLQGVTPPALAADPRVLHEQPIASRRILVVDDHPLLRFAMIDAMLGQGYECEGAEDGLAALASLRTRPVDLVVTDLSMPRMGGIELLAHMSASPITRSIPVIVVTAYLTEELRQQILNAGAKAVVTRSVRPDEILSAVRMWLSGTTGSKPGLALAL